MCCAQLRAAAENNVYDLHSYLHALRVLLVPHRAYMHLCQPVMIVVSLRGHSTEFCV